MRLGVAIGISAGLCAGGEALGQFQTPASTPVRERIVGTFIPGEEGPTPEGGDQIAALDNQGPAGVFQFDAGGDGSFSLLIFGDDPETEEKEGPRVGERLRFRFYDSSTNSEIVIVPVNEQGEAVNLTFQGQEIPDLPIDLPGLDLTPSRTFDMTPGDEGGGGGDGDGESAGQFDVNGDGRVDTEDAALVLRAVMRGGGTSSGDGEGGGSGGTREDVNGDGVVNTTDAIEVLRNRS